MPTITNRDVRMAVGALNLLAEMDLPYKVSFQVRDVMRALAPRADDIQAELKKLQEKHAVTEDTDGAIPLRDERGNIVGWLDGEAIEAAERELMAVTFEVDKTIVLSEKDCKTIKPAILFGLGELVVQAEANGTGVPPKGKGKRR